MIRLKQVADARMVALAVGAVLLCACFAGSAQAASPAWRVLALTGPTNLPPVTSEIQAVTVDATGGTFALTFGSQTTGPIAFNASAADMQSALNSLSSIGGSGGSVEVGGGLDDPSTITKYFVRFRGSLAGTDVALMTADSSQLIGSTATASVVTQTPGGTPGKGKIAAYATNVGGAPTVGPTTVTVGPLPAGITTSESASGDGWSCLPTGSGQSTVTCTRAASLAALDTAEPVVVPVEIASAAAQGTSVPVVVNGGGAGPDPRSRNMTEVPIVISDEPVAPGVQAMWAESWDENGSPAVQAGSHPNAAGTMFMVNTNVAPSGAVLPAGDLRDVVVDLPPGFIGNPMVTERCPRTQIGGCGLDSFVGEANPLTHSFPPLMSDSVGDQRLISNDKPAKGYAAQFTIHIVESLTGAVASVRSDEDFGVRVQAPNVSPFYLVYGSIFVLEGEPEDSNGKAFLTAPTDCAHEALAAPVTTISTRAWKVESIFSGRSSTVPPVVGCEQLDDAFKPKFSFQPGSDSAATGTAAVAELTVDQTTLLEPDELAPPHLKKSVVTLPEGMVLNPAAADGLQACSTDQIGLMGTDYPAPNPIRFDQDPVGCPDGSKIGTAEVTTPLLENPLAATLYLAAQGDNPFNSLLAMYIVVEDEETGITLKLPGKVTPDPRTGQLTAEFDNNPQTPFESLSLKFRGGGPRSTMATPDVCSSYTTKGSFTPWSAPESGPPVGTEDSFTINKGVGGTAACPQTKGQRPLNLGFAAGSTAPVAGGHSPFTLRITRPDGSQEIDKVTVSTPPGFAATLAGVATCSDAQLAQALARSKPGDGKAELASPSCPAASQVGTTTIGAGVGSQPYYVKTGKIYRTGPYRGAKQSLSFIVPAVAGPFDLGVQVVRTALQVNPVTAQITAESDPIPQILQGIPLQIRDIRVDLDRPNFTINPTNCSEMIVSAQVTGGSGAIANLNNRFQVDGCKNLGFKPNLKIAYKGATKRSGNPGLRAVLTQPGGQANISRTVVVLPRGSMIDNAHVNNPCTRAQYAANACPASSILGTATAWSPLLDQPLSGNVYFRSNGGERDLPDLVASLKGEVDVELVGWIDAIQNKRTGTSRVRNTFAAVPDAPVSKFELKMKGGKLGLIENGKNLCKQKNRASVKMAAHNGRTYDFNPVVQTSCRKKKK